MSPATPAPQSTPNATPQSSGNSVGTSEPTPTATNDSNHTTVKMPSLSTGIEMGLEDLMLGPKMHANFDTFYTLQKKLMSGSYGTVFVGVHTLSMKEYAVKVVNRSKLSPTDDEAQLREVAILHSIANENKNHEDHNQQNQQGEDNGVINLIDFYPSPQTYHIVMELARGGDVFDRLARRKRYTEKDARDLARRMLESINFLHERGIAHRDIKPENLLLMDEHDDTQLKLADFGFARRFPLDNPDIMKTKCGTPAYVPPELIAGVPYGPGCDIWSAGCTLFMLLSGRSPFRIDTAGGKTSMFYQIRAGDFVFYNQNWGHVSLAARKLVLSMLQVDPKVRVTAAQALQSEWMTTHDDVLRRSILESSLKEIVSFQARRKLKGAIGAVMYAVGGKFWNIETIAVWRDRMYESDDGLESAELQTKPDPSPPKGNNGEKFNESPYSGTPPTFEQYYHLDGKLRAGKEATVWEGTSMETEKTYAIKVVDRTNFSHAEDAAVLNEVALLKSLRHKHIVPLLDFFEDPHHFYLIMKKCNGGDVLDRIANIKRYSEKDARELSKGLLQAVEFMHGRGIAHRDLKPQNLLLENNADNTSVQICDFGYAKRVHMPQSLTTLCGSVHYVAPELLKNHPYDESADNWSVGVIIYFLLVGFLPFYSSDQQKLFQLIRLGRCRYDAKHWASISDEARSLISCLLEVDTSKRYTATQSLQSDWIKNLDDAVLVDRNLGECQSGIKNEARRLSAVARTVQCINKKKRSSFLDNSESS